MEIDSKNDNVNASSTSSSSTTTQSPTEVYPPRLYVDSDAVEVFSLNVIGSVVRIWVHRLKPNADAASSNRFGDGGAR